MADLTVMQVADRPDLPSADELVRVVALDGPAGTGKSTVARELARSLGWRFVDTGATYRAATLAAIEAEVDPRDSDAVLGVVARSRIVLVTEPTRPAVLLDGRDVSSEVRSELVTGNVSAVSAIPAVRALLVSLQRQAMGTSGSVVEGRDIATVVAPSAGLKVFLDARPEVRARRRAGEASGTSDRTGDERTVAVGRALALRDSLDSRTNKLQVSEGAVHLDTSDLTLVQVVDLLAGLVADAGLTGRDAQR
jgi:cytidylate kinase